MASLSEARRPTCLPEPSEGPGRSYTLWSAAGAACRLAVASGARLRPPQRRGLSAWREQADFPPEDPIEILKRLMIGSEGTLGFVSQARRALAAVSPRSRCHLPAPPPATLRRPPLISRCSRGPASRAGDLQDRARYADLGLEVQALQLAVPLPLTGAGSLWAQTIGTRRRPSWSSPTSATRATRPPCCGSRRASTPSRSSTEDRSSCAPRWSRWRGRRGREHTLCPA